MREPQRESRQIITQWPDAESGGLDGLSSGKVPTWVTFLLTCRFTVLIKSSAGRSPTKAIVFTGDSRHLHGKPATPGSNSILETAID